MNNILTSRTNMVRTTLQYCTDNAAALAGIAAFAGVKQTADNKLVLIDQLDQLVLSGSEGVTLNTRLLRETMCNIAIKCGSAVCAYAATIDDFELIALTDFTLPKLDAMKKDEVANVCQGIYDAANAQVGNAGGFGYTAQDVTDLLTAINLYRTSMQKPQDRRADISVAIESITTLVRELIDDLLKLQIDKMVVTLKQTNPDFVAGYFERREIINIGSTSAKLRGTVKDNHDVPLVGVIVSIYETGTTNLVKQTASVLKGKFSISNIPAGDYDFKFEFNGYITKTEANVHISAGKELKRTVEMRRGGGSVTLSGDVAAGAIGNVPVNGVEAIDGVTSIRVTVTGSALRFYSATGNMDQPGNEYVDLLPGQIIQKYVNEFAQQAGFDSELEDFLNVKNIGGTDGHWDIKFDNLGE